jgi:lysophospholipase L1-like esterase
MILFLGDSLTWGQGLFYEKWKAEGKNVEELSIKYQVPKYPHEKIDYESDKFRKENAYPALVSKHFNLSFSTKWGNGGSNYDIVNILNILPSLINPIHVDLVVIQFTDFSRLNGIEYNNAVKKFTDNLDHKKMLDKYDLNIQREIDKKIVNDQLYEINKQLKKNKLKWIGISWRDDFGKILKSEYPNQYTSIYHNNIEHDSFDFLVEGTYNPNNLTSIGAADAHLNLKGHQIIANSIIRKIEKNNLVKPFVNL